MHSNLIVHRDIKLENILIDKNYKVKLVYSEIANQFYACKVVIKTIYNA
jgi:serine/threonine protein kinase